MAAPIAPDPADPDSAEQRLQSLTRQLEELCDVIEVLLAKGGTEEDPPPAARVAH